MMIRHRTLAPAALVLVVVGALGMGTDVAVAAGGRQLDRAVTRQASGANGASIARTRSAQADGQGGRSAARNGSWTSASGASGGGAVQRDRAADGSLSRSASRSASGDRGSMSSSGQASRDVEGNIVQSRSSTATNAATGNSVAASSSYSKETGFTHSATCYDAGGNTIACPKR